MEGGLSALGGAFWSDAVQGQKIIDHLFQVRAQFTLVDHVAQAKQQLQLVHADRHVEELDGCVPQVVIGDPKPAPGYLALEERRHRDLGLFRSAVEKQ